MKFKACNKNHGFNFYFLGFCGWRPMLWIAFRDYIVYRKDDFPIFQQEITVAIFRFYVPASLLWPFPLLRKTPYLSTTAVHLPTPAVTRAFTSYTTPTAAR
jgi:hypothetical protein